MRHKQIADSPDGQYRVYSGIRWWYHGLNIGGNTIFAYTTVEIGNRKQGYLGSLGLPKERVFFCAHSKEVASHWEGPTTLVITAGCNPTLSNASYQKLHPIEFDLEYIYQFYEEIEIKYEFKPEWAGTAVR